MSNDEVEVEVQVRCQGQMHTILLRNDGQLVFRGHPNARELALAGEALAAVDRTQCVRCADVLLAWRNSDRARLPAKLYEVRQCTKKRALIARPGRGGHHSTYECGLQALERRVLAGVRVAAAQAWARTSYRVSQSKWVGGDHRLTIDVVNDAAAVDARGGTQKVWDQRRDRHWSGTNSYHHITITRTWRRHVLRRGIAVVDGIFVLAVCREVGAVIEVLAARQGQGCSLRVEPARLMPTTTGGWSLCWGPIPDRRARRVAPAMPVGAQP